MKLAKGTFTEATGHLNETWTRSKAIEDPEERAALQGLVRAQRAAQRETETILKAMADVIPSRGL